MDFFVDVLSFNENNYPDTFFIECEEINFDKTFCIETDLFKIFGKYDLMLDCREANLKEGILNIKYLKTYFKK